MAILLDTVRPRRWAAIRALLFLEFLLAMEIAGIALSGAVWLPEALKLNEERFIRRNYWLQDWWGSTLAKAAIRIFRLKVSLEAPFVSGERPFILLIRHSSFADTLLPLLLISNGTEIRLRYVLKRELLWEPCLDIIGNRIPNVFVRRGSEDTPAQLKLLRALASNLTEGDGIVIYPEGTRFSREKLERAKMRAWRKGREAYSVACRFNSILPPKTSGALALLDESMFSDVVFCAHTGLQRATTLRELLNGSLIGETIRVSFAVVPREEIPETEAQRKAWIVDRWCEVDRLVTQWEESRDRAAGTETEADRGRRSA